MKTEPEPDLAALAAWCGRQPLFANWSPETLRDYLAFHHRQRTLYVVETFGQFRAVAVGYGGSARELWALWRTALTHRHHFRWQPALARPEIFVVCEVVAVDFPALQSLVAQMLARTPEWAAKPIYTFRHDVIHRLERRVIRALVRRKGSPL